MTEKEIVRTKQGNSWTRQDLHSHVTVEMYAAILNGTAIGSIDALPVHAGTDHVDISHLLRHSAPQYGVEKYVGRTA